MANLFLHKEIKNKSIVWFKNHNQYVVLEKSTALILKKLESKISIQEITKDLSKKLNIPYETTFSFIQDIENKLYLPNIKEINSLEENLSNNNLNTLFFITKFYKINNLVFKIDFESEYEVYLIDPKFSHLTIENQSSFNFHYQIYTQENLTFLILDTVKIGSWIQEEIHYFQGKFSMMITQNIHHKNEEKWMGVFHASAVSNGKKAVLFSGDSGNGKSTSLAILQANNFNCLADDFVPIDIENKHVYSFPAAISIKKNSIPTLLPMYPELENSSEFHFKSLNKIVRFLKPHNRNNPNHLPCSDLVFIKYKKESSTEFNIISQAYAFEQLVPDSWISPIEKNAQIFLDWFTNLNCYQLTYSNNDEMIETVTKIFNDEL